MTRDRSFAGGGPRPRAAPSPSPLHTVGDVAGTLCVCERTVRRLIARGDLLAHRVGRSVRIGDADLRAYLADSRR